MVIIIAFFQLILILEVRSESLTLILQPRSNHPCLLDRNLLQILSQQSKWYSKIWKYQYSCLAFEQWTWQHLQLQNWQKLWTFQLPLNHWMPLISMLPMIHLLLLMLPVCIYSLFLMPDLLAHLLFLFLKIFMWYV